ncbi:MAG: ABC transporter permease subunit, partial [Alphaproteobacteria bacterium]|nr:ABC transporter permease subunit [Alphaproteobacteria bacterium]
RIGEAVFVNLRGISVPALTFEGPFLWVLLAAAAGIALAAALARWARRRSALRGRAPVVWPAILALLVLPPVAAFYLAGAPVEASLPKLGRFNVSGGFTLPQSFTALFIALSTYTAAFVSEVVRGGIQAVARGQREAAAALGLRDGQIMRLVILPQALRVIIPPLTNQYLNLFKNSALGTAVAFPDVFATFGGTTLNQTGQAVEVLAIVGIVYLSVSLLVSLGMNLYNRAIALRGGR